MTIDHYEECPACKPHPEEKNHPPGMIFVGWRGWETCSRCGGTTRVAVPFTDKQWSLLRLVVEKVANEVSNAAWCGDHSEATVAAIVERNCPKKPERTAPLTDKQFIQNHDRAIVNARSLYKLEVLVAFAGRIRRIGIAKTEAETISAARTLTESGVESLGSLLRLVGPK